MERNQFVIHISDDTVVDIALMTDRDWQRIKNDTKFLMKTGHTKDPAQAYIAAFVCYLKDIELLTECYNPDKHRFI